MLREVETLKACDHKNIIRLLSSFTAGRYPYPLLPPEPQGTEGQSSESQQDEYLYLLFPKADGNMKDYMNRNNSRMFRDRDEFRRYLYASMQQLASALAYIHREKEDGKHAFHHDLKPANILQSREGSKGSNRPTWLLCDFGYANLKSRDEDSGTLRVPATYRYRPPECYVQDSRKGHGRAYDVWSLGCVFLELATLAAYEHGPDKLENFRKMRLDNKSDLNNTSVPSEEDDSFFNNWQIVEQWINTLPKPKSDTLFAQVRKLILEMLERERAYRVFAWEIELDLYCALENLSEALIKAKLKECVRFSKPKEPLSGSERQHNPFVRARKNGRPEWWLKILEEAGWNDYSTKLSRLQNGEPPPSEQGPGSVNKYYSTLTQVFQDDDSRLHGRLQLYGEIVIAFSNHHRVGLHGFWGIG